MSEKHKLPRVKSGTPRRNDDWTAPDRRAKLKIVGAVLLPLALVAAGLWLIVEGFRE